MSVSIFYPIHIDRWRSPIASLLREIAIRNPDFLFHSFSKPETDEDKQFGETFWKLKHVHKLHSSVEVLHRRFDIVHHASATLRNFVAARLARMRGAVHVFTANIEPCHKDKYLKWYERSVLKCDVLVAVSEAVARSVERWWGRKADVVIPNGVDIVFFSRENANLCTVDFLGVKRPYVLYCAVLEERKRPDIFLEIAKRMPDINFVMVGGFHSKTEAEKYLRIASSLSNVKYVGRQSRSTVRDLMAGAEALVFPSEVEGLPLTVLEALSMGLPVLAQPRSSLPEVVLPGKTGWLLEGDSLDTWVDTIVQILCWDKDRKRQFEEEARRFVEQHFSWDVVAARYRDLYLHR